MMSNKKETVSDGIKLAKHLVIIVLLIIMGAAAAHFGLVIFTRHSAHCVVPQFKGLILDEAEMLAEKHKLNIVINDSLYAPMYEGGMVLDQLPKSGVGVKPGRTIYVTINAFGVKMVNVPYVAGRSLRQAKNMLEVAGLQIKELVYKQDMATNYVLAQFCGETEITEESSHEATIGSGVTLHVGMSDSNNTVVVPQLIGMTLREAKSRLWESGLNIGRINMPSDATPDNQGQARVYQQSRNKGDEIRLGNSISITFTLDNEKVEEVIEYVTKMEAAAAKLKAQEEDSLAKVRIMELSRQNSEAQSKPQIQAEAQSEQEESDEDMDSFFE
ncbi:MAG: PASTA domain-containing protein [Rikenellaceae bacterium]